MASPEDIFASMKLGVVVPEAFHDLPDDADESWLLEAENEAQREKAFFDERLLFFFIAKLEHPTDEEVDPKKPPIQLAQYLSRLQITLDAKYISMAPQRPVRSSSQTPGINLSLPPRSHSYHKGMAKSKIPPSIFPPHTPNPTPQTAEADRKYAGSTEGTILETFVWGETARDEPEGRKFALIWSSQASLWVAVYRLTVGIAFLRTPSPDPVLSLTVSATLREKPLVITPDRQALADVLQAAGGLSDTGEQIPATPINGTGQDNFEEELHGLQEINLLDGLVSDSTLAEEEGKKLSFPSTRLGTSYRRTTFSLPPIQRSPSTAPSDMPMSAITPLTTRAPSVLRMSFMKTLQTVSGFQIRMKSVFVPYVAIPGTTEDEDERREAGAEERTIVLSVEMANGSPYTGPGSTGFNVENIEVKVGGEGAQAHLITWGEGGFHKGQTIFPLKVGPAEQFNLLYAITFLRQSESDEIADTLRQEANTEKLRPVAPIDIQRPVAIIVQGKPFDYWASRDKSEYGPNALLYPTKTFRSRWNCILDLSSNNQMDTFDGSLDSPSSADALPAPATPFPAVTPTTAKYPTERSGTSTPMSYEPPVAGKRHTYGGAERTQRASPMGPYRNSTSILSSKMVAQSPISSRPTSPRETQVRFSPTPPSIAVTRHTRFASTAAITNIPSPLLVPQTPSPYTHPPQTPAYPAYPVDGMPSTPAGQSPISSYRHGITGSSIEPRRERQLATLTSPDTPGPKMFGSFFPEGIPERADDGEPIIASIGLIPKADLAFPDLIYSLDTIEIEIFVFNRSERTRRFEVTYPDNKRRRQQGYSPEGSGDLGVPRAPGLVSLDNRVRVGPLRPHTCQSVRMRFLALRPGVHSIASLTLLDVETGFSKNLKSVMDVVVHDLNETKLLAANTPSSLSLLAH